MRRRPGIAGLQTAAAARGQYKALGEHVAKERTTQMKEQLEVFRKNLEDFASKHKNDIRKHPEFRAQFHTMCAKCGVDPLASRKGFWAELLGIGDFYFELGVQITDVCLVSRQSGGGGLLDLAELRGALQTRRRAAASAAEAITEDDCLRAISKLKALGGGFDIVTIGSRKYVRSVPSELSTDHSHILQLAQGTGHVTETQVRNQLRWGAGRTTDALDAMLKEGIAMIDDGHEDGQRRFWFPCISAPSTTNAITAS